MDQTEALIIETIDRHREEILEFARDIYSHAELGYKEFQTSGKFVKKMEQYLLTDIKMNIRMINYSKENGLLNLHLDTVLMVLLSWQVVFTSMIIMEIG